MASQRIRFPTYPTGSYNFLRNVTAQSRLETNGVTSHARDSKPKPVQLDVIVIGAGVAGLSTAIALKRKGHAVRVYEAAGVLSEVGAGIQVPPNSARILHSWGLETRMRKRSVKPDSLIWRRWGDGNVIAHTRLNPQMEDWFAAPYYVTHRAHLHQVLHEKVVELGVPVMLGCRVREYLLEGRGEAGVVLESGERVTGDLVVAADGVKSTARKQLLGDLEKGPQTYGLAAYRATVSVADIKANPITRWVAESRSLNLWVGHDLHAMTYTIAGGELFNLVLTHPDRTHQSTWDQRDLLEEMRGQYVGWDRTLTELLNMVTKTTKWPIQMIKVPENWVHKSNEMLITGDAAHAMLPYMALGAASAVEDAAALAECLSFATSKHDIQEALQLFQAIRVPRVKQNHEASLLHGTILHFPDGPEQHARDAAMRAEVEGKHFVESPNQWSDPTMQVWCYGYDVVEEVKRAGAKRKLRYREFARDC